MTKFKLLFILLISIFYSCKNVKNLENNKLSSKLGTKTSQTANSLKNTSDKTKITVDEIIKASEHQINFYKTASKENLIAFLGISKERIQSVSDKEFNKLVREGNAYMYKNLIDELKKDKIDFELISEENDIFEISFKEKGNDSFGMVMKFEYVENEFKVVK